MQLAKHHESTLLKIQTALQEILPADQKAVLIVYDGPSLLTRQASWVAPGASNEEAYVLLKQIAEQASGKANR